MNIENAKASDEIQIRNLIDNRIKAIREKNIERALSCFAPDVISFDVIGSLLYTSSDAVKERLEQWFSSFKDSINFEISGLEITASGDTAFSHNLNHVQGNLQDGGVLDMWWRETACYSRINGKWMIVHNHNSVPFDGQSGKASVELKPDTD